MSIKEVLRQTALLERPPAPPTILGPCVRGNGIDSLTGSRRTRLEGLARKAISEGRVAKFVPASGAATRLFSSGHKPDRYLDALLGKDLLSLARRPKGLIPFHRVGQGTRTAFEEHLWEGVVFSSRQGILKTHFTVPRNSLSDFRRLGKICADQIERRTGKRVRLAFSVQDPATDTLAWEEKKGWVRNEGGGLLFRPGGHGALLKNLEATGGDIVLIKNIDNVPRAPLQAAGNRWRMALVGRLIEVQTEAHAWIARLLPKTTGEESVRGAEQFISHVLGVTISARSLSQRKGHAIEIADRPWRVCGMVPNVGEPGGGPFWVMEGPLPSRQILEASQLGKSQKRLLKQSTHFNPVDMVVGLKNWQGRPFDLTRFSDPSQGIVTEKHFEGRAIRTLEHPGLWNGGMAHWNTLFIEVPAAIFHPVKTITDLLRPGHRGQY